VYGTLSTLCWDVAEHRGVSGPGDRDNEYTLLEFLDKHIDYFTRHAELAVEVDTQLRDLVSGLRPVTGDRRRRMGRCLAMVEVEEVVHCHCGHVSSQHDNDAVTSDRRCNEAYCGCQAFTPPPRGSQPAKAHTRTERCNAVVYAPVDDGLQAVITCPTGLPGHSWSIDDWLDEVDALDSESSA
jgi:hypothetical protein